MDRFPLQTRDFPLKDGKAQINWAIAELAYKEYLDHYYGSGHGGAQSLERLAERGGFGVAELINLLCGRITRLENEIAEMEESDEEIM